MFEKIKLAQELLKDKANVTPVFTSKTLNERAHAKVFLKCENYQRVGAFKFRGAYNAIYNLPDEEKRKGIITYSSGNHAQAVALVCRLLSLKATVIMPENAPKIKRDATKSYGAEIIEYNPEKVSREEFSKEIIKERNFTLIPPFDNEDIIAGQGTAAYEFINQVKDLDYLLVPCGGGGLLSGSAISAKNLLPKCKVIGIEPKLADDAVRSFRTKTLQTVKNPATIADGTRTASLGNLTFPIILNYVDDMITVSETEIIEAVKFLFYRMKLVVEPSGALGIAALLNDSYNYREKIGVIISGGNIDEETMCKLLKAN
jgi:threo-3-hydroxy-L-aspartate ammonia-lyase